MMKPQGIGFMIAAALSLLTLCQCATDRVVPVRAGQGHLDVSAKKGNLAGLRGVKIASVNGVPVNKQSAYVKTGKVDAVVSVAWPRVGECKIPVKFRAKEGRSYYMRYDQYPAVGKSKSGTNKATRGMMNVAGGLAQGGPGVGFLAIPIAGTAIVTGFLSNVSRGLSASGTGKLRKTSHFIDMMVISELNSEGVVSHVRAYASGRVEIRMQR
jgi:hypothetical protein